MIKSNGCLFVLLYVWLAGLLDDESLSLSSAVILFKCCRSELPGTNIIYPCSSSRTINQTLILCPFCPPERDENLTQVQIYIDPRKSDFRHVHLVIDCTPLKHYWSNCQWFLSTTNCCSLPLLRLSLFHSGVRPSLYLQSQFAKWHLIEFHL